MPDDPLTIAVETRWRHKWLANASMRIPWRFGRWMPYAAKHLMMRAMILAACLEHSNDGGPWERTNLWWDEKGRMTEGPKPEQRDTLFGFPIEYVEVEHPFGDQSWSPILGESLLADREWRVGDIVTLNDLSPSASGTYEVLAWDRATNMLRLRKVDG